MQDLKNLGDEAFVAKIMQRPEGFSESIMNNPEGFASLFPIVRADFSLLAAKFILNEKLRVPITTIRALDDTVISETEVKLWFKATECSYDHISLPQGGHLALLNDPMLYVNIVKSILLSNRKE